MGSYVYSLEYSINIRLRRSRTEVRKLVSGFIECLFKIIFPLVANEKTHRTYRSWHQR